MSSGLIAITVAAIALLIMSVVRMCVAACIQRITLNVISAPVKVAGVMSRILQEKRLNLTKVTTSQK